MDQPPWLDEREQRAWRAYRRLRLLADSRIARDLTVDSGLSEPDYDVLSELSEAAGHRRRLGELADRMLWSQSRMSHHIKRMQQRGLVRREDCAGDGRGADIVLTDDGLRAIEEAASLHVASVRRNLIDLLTKDQVQALAEIGETVVRRSAEADAGDGTRPRG
ncbi:MarR family winged helix-turn-helix transcriptional regulator [Streptomyces sp. SID3343]|uniref:MarR family winged helix-turn-helix transcriptional regulator n=1 Tax=Streptomyces sp. SID3343 TaxID=2690260 RepID=UPI00136EFAAD|nr:MarR family winged helix-turn-helix transcriptional regulator [Streptomyces sp. SID3343]MYW05007.1 MarR family transcriptional regulator [Streptomyces sp. SID3343]